MKVVLRTMAWGMGVGVEMGVGICMGGVCILMDMGILFACRKWCLAWFA